MINDMMLHAKIVGTCLDFRNFLINNLNISPRQVENILPLEVSEKIINLVLEDKDLEKSTTLAPLFFMTIGDKHKEQIKKYRNLVFDKLEKLGAEGEKRWSMISQNLYQVEREGHGLQEDNHCLYPRTIMQAKNKFL